MDRELVDIKTYNRLKTDLIHIKNDLMTNEERSLKIAHVVEYTKGFLPKVASAVNDEMAFEALCVEFGLEQPDFSAVRVSKKEARSLMQDLLYVKFETSMDLETKKKALNKIADSLWALKVANPATANPPVATEPKVVQIMKALKSKTLPSQDLLDSMSPTVGQILVEESPGVEYPLKKDVVASYIGDIIAANKTKTVQILSNPKIQSLLGVKYLAEEIRHAFKGSESSKMEFLPHFEDLYQQAGTVFEGRAAQQILEFLFREEIDKDPRKLFLLIKRIDSSGKSNSAVSVLSRLGAQDYPALKKQYWDQFRLGSEDLQDEPVAAPQAPAQSQAGPTTQPQAQPQSPVSAPAPQDVIDKLERMLFSASISGDPVKVKKVSDQFKALDRVMFARAQKKAATILLYMQHIKLNDTLSAIDTGDKLRKVGVPDDVIRSARRKAEALKKP